MPVICLVVGCSSRSNKHDNVSFFSVPAVLNHRFLTNLNELSKRRRERWIAAIRRADLTETKIKNQRVCSKHFLTGKPAPLEDENGIDWVPSQNMGHTDIEVRKTEDVDPECRVKKRKTLMDENIPAYHEKATEDTGVGTQTNITMEELTSKLSQLTSALNKIKQLEEKIEVSPFGLARDSTNVEKWKYYTGNEYTVVRNIIFPEIQMYIPSKSATVLSKFNQLLLTLIKLKLDLHFKDLAYRFKISPTTASTYFVNIIDVMYQRLKWRIQWPEHSVYLNNVPYSFKEAFQEKTIIIVDCLEVFIEKPASNVTQEQCWSNYKDDQTIKFLIGITPQGTISYISNGWGGHTSDKEIVELSGFCDNIKPGDIVLADREFFIEEILGTAQAKMVIPAFTRDTKNQLHPIEFEETQHITHVREHVEKIIGAVKHKFEIVNGIIPMSMLKKSNNLDKIVTVCCALINI